MKNNKGFSLMEVLVAVGLISIITAIAVPQFQDYREQTGLVAGNTSVSNIARAYQNCMALNSFSDCNAIEDIKIACPECSDGSASRTAPPFCANYVNSAGGKDFRMCVTVDGDNNVEKTIGGSFKVCHNTCSGASCPGGSGPGWSGWSTPKVPTTVKRCKDATTDCISTDVKPPDGTNKTYSTSCQANQAPTAGTCKGDGTCQ